MTKDFRNHERMSLSDRRILIRTIVKQFKCNPQGLHGVSHWARVRFHAVEIAKLNGADFRVVELFAFLHDSQRLDEYRDPDHGKRAAAYAVTLRGSHFSLEDLAFSQLQEALEGHSGGGVHKDVTIQTCWDADRLDLVRLHIDPRPDFLSDHAIKRIDRAWKVLSRRPTF